MRRGGYSRTGPATGRRSSPPPRNRRERSSPMASWLPKSRTARRRLMILAAVAPVLALAVGLSLYAMRGSVSLFLVPSQALQEKNLQGRAVQLGGFVRPGSLVKHDGDEVEFVVADDAAPAS